jgi:hypothetical protein
MDFGFLICNIPCLQVVTSVGMFLGLPDPVPLVSGTDPDLSLFYKVDERTEIMLAK